MIAFFEIPTNDFEKSVAFYQALSAKSWRCRSSAMRKWRVL